MSLVPVFFQSHQSRCDSFENSSVSSVFGSIELSEYIQRFASRSSKTLCVYVEMKLLLYHQTKKNAYF